MYELILDEDGQPPRHINLENNAIKAVNTLYGLIMGMTADKLINEKEIHFLNLWLLNNQDYTSIFPLNVIRNRINDILADGIITDEEREDFHQTLTSLIGGTFDKTGSAGGLSSAYDNEKPDSIIICNSLFCLTGKFISGPREKCERIITRFGGKTAKNVTKELDYLVIGTLASRDWVGSSHGRKIEKALHYKQKGHLITILSEETWTKYFSIY
jgi:NAD-dependent DNA ligase